MVTQTEATQESEEDLDCLEDDQDERRDDRPSQEALENHLPLAYLQHCMSLPDYLTHDD